MKNILFVLCSLLTFLNAHFVHAYGLSLYEQAERECADGAERYVIITHDKQFDITTQENNTMGWDTESFMDVVEQYDRLFVIRCTWENTPLAPFPKTETIRSSGDFERAIEMEYRANMDIYERRTYKHVYNGIADFTNKVFVVFGISKETIAALLKQLGKIPKEERIPKRFTYKAGNTEKSIIFYPEPVSSRVDTVLFLYRNHVQGYQQKLCQSDQKALETQCARPDIFDFSIGIQQKLINMVFYVDAYRKKDIPLEFYVIRED